MSQAPRPFKATWKTTVVSYAAQPLGWWDLTCVGCPWTWGASVPRTRSELLTELADGHIQFCPLHRDGVRLVEAAGQTEHVHRAVAALRGRP